MKKVFYTELAYFAGLFILALGTALMERADFGMSMVVAPAYLVYLKVSEVWPWFTFGMAEYCFQALLLIVLSITLCKFKIKFLISFATAFLYGNILDLSMWIVGFIPGSGIIFRIIFYLLGLMISAVGVSLLFHTYIPPEVYELFVKELSEKTGRNVHVVKTEYDCCSCLLAILLSFLFFGFMKFEGVKLGTIFCVLVNGWLIGKCSSFFEKRFLFKDALKR